jgi:hypothetical protein
MSTNKDDMQTMAEKTPTVSSGTYSPVTVTVTDTIGAVFLGILAVTFLIGWRHAETRYHKLITHLELTNGDHASE